MSDEVDLSASDALLTADDGDKHDDGSSTLDGAPDDIEDDEDDDDA